MKLRETVAAAQAHLATHLPLSEDEKHALSDAAGKPLPDRVSIDPRSVHYFDRYNTIGVKVNGRVVFNCAEYCRSEGWALLLVKDGRGRVIKERGVARTTRVTGIIENYWRA